MARAPFQVLVLPYRATGRSLEFAVLCRSDDGRWQGIAGGGEEGETPLEAARREASEEVGIPPGVPFLALDALCSVPVYCFKESAAWGEDRYVIPEHSFGVDCSGIELVLSDEHREACWLPFVEAHRRLTYESNRTAVWELHQRLRGLGPREPAF
jgi:dihydroneopterin triphosphate diphosphatase